MDNAILQIVMRYLHVVSAIIAVGGLAFVSLALLPSLRLFDESFRGSLMQALHQRFQRVVWLCVGGLVLSGTFNWMALAGQYKSMGPLGNALIGTKVLLAVILFAVIWAHGAGFGRDKSPRFWLMMKLHLAAVIILLGSVLRYFRLEHLTGS